MSILDSDFFDLPQHRHEVGRCWPRCAYCEGEQPMAGLDAAEQEDVADAS